MNTLLINTIGTEVVLLISIFLLHLSSKKDKKAIIIHSLLFIIGGIPLIYLAIDHSTNDYSDANIGLGLIFIYTWIFSLVTIVVGIIKLMLKKKKSS
ncbi:hypothetical protein [Shimazuella alba]|uniref:Uncharacterized protein n=1 Tax=Shimazuella alba TaxID=2690964 RepID=A0A6I4VPW5_9BACL|nr:hypothetical protein [Shimazuella alba]MXQ52438.1 hypothetical protein [Shimazuella alba]